MTPSPVVHVVVAGEIGGAERMLIDLARAPTARPHVVALMTPNDALRSLLVTEGLDVEDYGPVREDPLAYLARTFGRREVAWLEAVIRRRGARLVHLHTFGSQVVGTRAALRTGCPVVRTEHSTRVYDDPSCWPFSRWSLERADVAVCISEHVRDVARDKAPWAEPRLRVVPNGVDLARFSPAPLPPLVGAADATDATVRFVAVGRLEPRKGFDLALRALAEVPRAELVIVGDGQARAGLEALAARLGLASRVRFAGFSRDVRGHVAAAHLALSSARAEGLGIALIEAMAMGRAIVALPTGGVPELVREGETGWLAHGGGAAALARVMQDAVEAGGVEIARRGARARELAAARFSVGAMRTTYERIYGELSVSRA